MPTRRRFLPLVACLAAPALLEVAARVAATVAEDVARAKVDERIDWLVFSPTLGWERRPGFKGIAGLAEREFDAGGYFADDRNVLLGRRGHRKVVFIGDSNTFGFGAKTSDSFVKVVERRLPSVDTINLGAMGYTSYQGRLVVEKQLPLLKPDLVVASFNVNDRRYAQPVIGQDGPETFRRLYQQRERPPGATAQLMQNSYVYRALRHLLRTAGFMKAADDLLDVSRLVPRVGPEAYRDNLRQIVALARAMHVPVMFVVLRDSPLQVGPLRAGIESMQHGELNASIAHLEQAAEGPPMFSALARIYLAQALAAKGDRLKAAQMLKTRSSYGSFRGGQLVRLDTEYNDIMREVARETGSELVEGAEVLEQEPLDFIDNCHFNAEGHRRLGDLLAKRIAAALGTPINEQLEAHASR